MVISSANAEVQKAVFRKLETHLGTTPVYDDIPPNAAYPYVVIGETTETDKPNTHSSRGREGTLTIHVWSRYPGMAEVHEIGGRIIEILENEELHMAGWTWEQSKFEMFQTLRDPDGITRHGVIRFRIRSRRD